MCVVNILKSLSVVNVLHTTIVVNKLQKFKNYLEHFVLEKICDVIDLSCSCYYKIVINSTYSNLEQKGRYK